MKIEFRLILKNESDTNVIPAFCDMLVHSIGEEIFRDAKKSKIDMRKDSVIKAPWMTWNSSADRKEIDSVLLVKMICNNIIWKNIKDDIYVIEIDKKVKYPQSQTKIERIARFIDKGTLRIQATCFVSAVFNKYRKQLPKFWNGFLQVYFKRLDVDYTLTIK